MENKFYNILILILFILVSFNGFSQDRPVYTHFMFNQTAINPAYAGVPESLNITGLFRKQWVNFDGAPSTQTIIAHAPVKRTNVSLGVMAFRDVIGITSTSELSTLYAYKIRFSEKSSLSLGLQAGMHWNKEDFGQLYEETDDSQFSQSFTKSKFLIGSGLFFHTERFYAGASIPVIHTKEGLKNHYFITTGYVFDLGSSFKLKPHAMIKMADNAPLSYDLNTSLLIKEMIWVGVSYRSNESVGFLTELQITNDVRFGYSFDMPAGDISSYSNGSHEVMLSYRFNFPYIKYKSPRYF